MTTRDRPDIELTMDDDVRNVAEFIVRTVAAARLAAVAEALGGIGSARPVTSARCVLSMRLRLWV